MSIPIDWKQTVRLRYHLECNGCGWWTGNNTMDRCRYCQTPLRAARYSDYVRRGIKPAEPFTRRHVKAWVRHRSTKTRVIMIGELRRWIRSRTTPIPVRMWCWEALRYRQTTRTQVGRA